MSLSNNPKLLNEVVDVSTDFKDIENEYFLADKLVHFDPSQNKGKLQWRRSGLYLDWAFNKLGLKLDRLNGKELPQEDYEIDPVCDFSFDFISQRCIRLRLDTSKIPGPAMKSLMLKPTNSAELYSESQLHADKNWKYKKNGNAHVYTSTSGKIILQTDPWEISVYDRSGTLLTKTFHHKKQKALHTKTLPFLFLRRARDYSRSVAASFTISYDEKFYGCGESFTRLNKRGQKVNLWPTDAQSAASREMYKPIPFFMSSRGYGMFVHTTAPCTFDFGNSYDGTATLYSGDDQLDLFLFIGSPKEILFEYTVLTGRSPVPPFWSFGLWMSRLSYKSQDEVVDVADKLRINQIPCDVIHIDAGWFEHGWRCDFKFGKKTFPEPEQLMKKLKENGFRTSLWQLPYFTPENPLYNEIIEKGLFIKNEKGGVPTEDVILDFSNTDTVSWYRQKIEKLFDLGASAIKADFGECAPLNGIYNSGKSGFYEHNNYPLRYTKLVSEITKDKTGDAIIWARSAWAGSQRFPVHWGGDAEVTDFSMAATLRAGLSLGLSGFTFWSHDIGGFSGTPSEDLYLRWLAFGIFTSHSRCHGFPPKEPWHFSKEFLKRFREITEIKYRLMPYVYAQSVNSASKGLPLLRALFLEFPDDPDCWLVEDEYMFGKNFLIAPLFESNKRMRNVYLPHGKWIDYQTGDVYEGGQWTQMNTHKYPIIILVRNGSVIPHISLAQSTYFMDWTKINLNIYSDGLDEAHGIFSHPENNDVVKIDATYADSHWNLSTIDLIGDIEFDLNAFDDKQQ